MDHGLGGEQAGRVARIGKLKTADSEEAFRVKQKKFDRTLGFLAEGIQLAKEEAGL